MNGNSPPTLHKQFNTVHFIQVYIVRNNLYALFFSLWLLHPPIAFISQDQMLFKKNMYLSDRFYYIPASGYGSFFMDWFALDGL